MGPQAKRRKTSKVEEITFDHSARHEFLTGFRKRKQQRIKQAQEVAEQKAREMKREERKRIREEREAEFQNALEEHQKQLKRLRQEEDGASSGSDSESDDEDNEEWEGFEEPPAVDYEAEYIDEDKYTTVTVEEMDASREGLLRSQEHSSDEEQGEEKPTSEANSKPKPVEKTKKASDKPKKKKKKFRYESKAERQLTRKKERLSNSRKAKARRER
ncbi:nucleolar protein 12-domain-containing protein [Aspergillus tamarii]|uniref:Nucleolar protein 12-domain-containing protein n=1 Tax=Aspergillus tamarii TaxID=41984 RepID=A0A5N6V0D2_ASPTM|nr:nucleolar protein 12-domain-containing protein [Aspergillus tamarii]